VYTFLHNTAKSVFLLKLVFLISIFLKSFWKHMKRYSLLFETVLLNTIRMGSAVMICIDT